MEVNSREQKRSTKPQHMQGKQTIIYPCPSPLANSRPFHFSVLIRVFGIDKSFGGDMQPMATDRYGVLRRACPINTLTAYPHTLKQLQSQWKATHSIFVRSTVAWSSGTPGLVL